MSEQNCVVAVVAVDVGNSAVKFALQTGESVREHAFGVRLSGWEQAAIDWIDEQLDGADRDRKVDWRIASVHHAAASRLSEAARRHAPGTSIRFVSRHDVPLAVEVDHPDRVGIDRLLGAYAASRRTSLPAVVIDAGSAVTVDWIGAEGHFCGGAILPGLGLQARALAGGTGALPEIGWDCQDEIRLPARNTRDAIRSGILAGVSASVDALVERYRDAAGLSDGESGVVMTGGDAPTISPHLRHAHQRIPNLVCRGLLDLPRSMGGKTNAASEPL